MRIAVVLFHLPVPEGYAAGRCAIAMLRGLKAQGHEVTALAPDWKDDASAIPADLDVETVPVVFDDGKLQRWTRPRSTLTRGPFAQRARELAAEADVVFLDEIDTARLATELDTPALAHLNCWAGRDRELGAPWTRDTRDAVELMRAERHAAKSAPYLAGCSPELVADIRSAGGKDVQLIRLGLDPEFYAPGKPIDAPVAGMIGSAHWPPTRAAVTTLLTDVWPRIHAEAREATLRLAGHGMVAESFPALEASDGVEWLGEVESASDFLRSLALQLYPVTRGSGTKVKVLESLFLGVPVVTTTSGIEGMSENGGVFASDNLDAIVATTTELLGDRAARKRRSKDAIAYANERHSPAAIGKIVADALAKIS